MKPDELRTFLTETGWQPDKFGHYHRGEYRFKFQQTSVRLERSYQTSDTQYSKGEKRWLRLRSAYFSQLEIKEGKLSGLTK